MPLAEPGDSSDRREGLLEQLLADYLQQVERGTAPTESEFIQAHPQFAGAMREFFADRRHFARVAAPFAPVPESMTPPAAGPPSSVDEPTLIPGATAPSTSGPARVRYFGDYELLEEIARGGMGVVYRTRQVNLKRIVALKMILVGQLANADEVKRFYAEAQAAAKLEHPHIVPIFEIGQHAGQHYFTMAYIDGESLAHRVAREVLPPREAAALSAKVTRAIAFAHVEGVVHRDLKPANILIDRAGEPHVTDFGLAKRVGALDPDETGAAELTATGQVLGTPSYMPPEQASGKTAAVGPLADVYSLGAVLYCLLTGRPPFQAASPLDTLLQVIDQEPVSPRVINPAVPRDLATICLKCLEKSPAARYESAAALAEELERYLHGEPIKARPINLLEQVWRRARKQHRLLKSIAAAIAATILLGILGAIARDSYRTRQMSLLSLKTDGVPLTAQVLDRDSDAVVRATTVPTDQPIDLWPGDYRLRVSGPGLPSQTYEVSLDPRQTREMTIDLAQQKLWKPLRLGPVERFDVAEIGDRSDLIFMQHDRFGTPQLHRLAGNDLRVQWSLPLSNSDRRELARDDDRRLWRELAQNWASNYGHRPLLIPPGTWQASKADADLVFAWPERDDTALAALSGQSGSVTWVHSVPGWNRMLARPVLVQAVDERGPILIVLGRVASGRLWAEGLSAIDGTVLWHRELGELPLLSSSMPTYGSQFGDEEYRFPCSLTPVGMRDRTAVAVVTPQGACGIDPVAGGPAWTIPFPRPPVSQTQFVDVDGDGADEMTTTIPGTGSENGQRNTWDFAVYDLPAGAVRWQSVQPSPNSSTSRDADLAVRDRVHCVDVDGDHKPEVALPVESNERLEIRLLDGATGHSRWTRVLSPRRPAEWKQFLDLPDVDADQVREIVVISTCSIDAAETGGPVDHLFIDVLSGADGHSIATWRGPRVRSDSRNFEIPYAVERARWWQADAQGLPQILVSLANPSYWQRFRRRVVIVSPLAGRETQSLDDVLSLHEGDFNGDGLPDLGVVRDTLEGRHFQVLAGSPPAAWRRAGDLQPGRDYDGDGLTEFVEVVADAERPVTIYSGHDGVPFAQPALQWKSRTASASLRCLTPALPAGDSNADGVPDLLLSSNTSINPFRDVDPAAAVPFPLQCLCGKTGRSLWREPDWRIPGDLLPLQPARLDLQNLSVRSEDLNGDTRGEILCHYHLLWAEKDWGGYIGQSWLAVISATDGTLVWTRSLTAPVRLPSVVSPGDLPLFIARETLDLDGDEIADLVVNVPVEVSDSAGNRTHFAFDLQACSGRDGQLLWPAKRLDFTRQQLSGHELSGDRPYRVPVPVVAHLAGERDPVILLAENLINRQDSRVDAQRACRVEAFSGADGSRRWSTTWTSIGQNHESFVPQMTLSVVDVDGDRQRRVCVRDLDTTPNETGDRLTIIDSHGVVERTLKGANAWSYDPASTRLWPYDLDGDGRQELVLNEPAVLKALRPDGMPLWTRPLGAGVWHVESIGRQDNRPVIVAGSNREFLGIDGGTGLILWRGEGPPQIAESGPRPFAAWCLPGDRQGTTPRILLRTDASAVTSCLPTRPDGGYRVVPIAAPPIVRSSSVDPRVVRQLPWSYQPRFVPLMILSGACGLAVIVLPGALACRALRRRPWTASTGVTLALVGAWVAGAAFAFSENMPEWMGREHPSQSIVNLAFAGALVVTFPLLLLRALWSRRWKSAARLAGTSLVISALIGLADWINFSSRLDPLERIDWQWSGLLNVWIAGAINTGGLAVVGLAAQGGWRALRKRFGSSEKP